jgi:hypothetical protein
VVRRKADDSEGIPVAVLAYDPGVHSDGGRAVDAWRHLALDWLSVNPGRELPCGSPLGVLRESVRLKGGYLHGDQRAADLRGGLDAGYGASSVESLRGGGYR